MHVVPLLNAHAVGRRIVGRREAGVSSRTSVEQLECRVERRPRRHVVTGSRRLGCRPWTACGYAREWAVLKKAWDLSITPAERDALAGALAGC